MVPVVQEALAKEMKVAAIDYLIGTDPTAVDRPGVEGITVQIADKMAEGGKAQGEQAAALCQGISPCKVMIEIGSKSNEFDVIKLTEIKRVLAQNPKIQIVTEAADGFEEAKAERTTRDELQANPDLKRDTPMSRTTMRPNMVWSAWLERSLMNWHSTESASTRSMRPMYERS